MRRRSDRDREWHEAQMAKGPTGQIRQRGVKTWAELSKTCGRFVAAWEAMPECDRKAYAFPNKEDRRA